MGSTLGGSSSCVARLNCKKIIIIKNASKEAAERTLFLLRDCFSLRAPLLLPLAAPGLANLLATG
jgi:hypothetical protein